MTDKRYLERLSYQFPTSAAAATEIINLSSILKLPKGTEHFITDIHGEYESFLHIMKNGSGSIRKKIDEEFADSLSENEKRALATLIYYPEEKIIKIEKKCPNLNEWYKTTIYRLVRINRRIASKYSNSKVKKLLPSEYSYVIEELLNEKEEVHDKEEYYNSIISAIINTKRAKDFIIAFCKLIQKLAVDKIHILGDIFDRGPGAHIILDTLLNYDNIDFQWGNHDICWIGASSGSPVCIASVIRISAKYGNFDTLENGYGINLLPLAKFAMETYQNDPCSCFEISGSQDYAPYDEDMDRKIHKAISIILFKLEGQLLLQHPEFQMNNRLLLDRIDKNSGTVQINDKKYPLEDCNFPTIDPQNPYQLSKQEEFIIRKLQSSFLNSEKLQKHINLLLTKGNMYKICNGNLLYHGCVPLEENGTFKKVCIDNQYYSGKELFIQLEKWVRKGYYSSDEKERVYGQNIMWFLWACENSPLFGKEKMTTFERYFVKDATAHKEPKNAYYKYLENKTVIISILNEFGLDGSSPNTHIINGHIPIHFKNGETPVKCNGKLLMIDGGLSRPIQNETGIAGYTLISNSYGLRLVAHEPFRSTTEAIENETDIFSVTEVVQTISKRLTIGDTDEGKKLQETIDDLYLLLNAYYCGIVKEMV